MESRVGGTRCKVEDEGVFFISASLCNLYSAKVFHIYPPLSILSALLMDFCLESQLLSPFIWLLESQLCSM